MDVSVSGDDDLATFCRHEWPRIVGVLSLYTGDAQLAEDLAQDALTRACRDWPTIGHLPARSAWLYKVAINAANSYFRRLRAGRRARERLRLAHAFTSDEPDQADALAIRRAVAGLPHRPRTALVLRYYGELSVREAAEVMKCPEGTVKRLTSDAIARLRQLDLLPGDTR